MDLRKIKKLIELLEESGITELEVRNGEESVRIARPMAPSLTPAAAPEPTVARSAVATSTLHAPMAGTFYVAPEPGAQPFTQVGSAVNVGETLCIIESMKMMNAIAAETAGVVVEILVGDGEPVATGQALLRIQ
ncbi:MAG: acetyl-CoA carboxylase biotin carboxyl carrier protein [Gammaproteobacteria bacterium]|nr:acetyl-CoA carboxylase biotin carboxyl carrier protein [Gammaproteobacteria bacterium]